MTYLLINSHIQILQDDPKVPVQQDNSNSSSVYKKEKCYGCSIFSWLSDGNLDHDLKGQTGSNSIF